PEYGATCGFFPIDDETIAYLKATGRKPSQIALVEKYARAQGMWRTSRTPDPLFTDTLELDMSQVEPSLAGPKRPQDRVTLANVAGEFLNVLANDYGKAGQETRRVPVAKTKFDIGHGDVLIAAITSCTNTSNPGVLVAAGLLARNALEKGLNVKPWVKTSFAPGSQVVTDYLKKAGLTKYLDKLGFNLVGYGCTTCIGNSGPLAAEISAAVKAGDLIAGSVSSGNRNFEGRINPDTQANYLASPPLVLAYAIAGNLGIDLTSAPLGKGKGGKPVFLKDIWPSNKEIAAVVRKCISAKMFRERYSDVFKGDANWR
ncbi:MAG TPA: aconitate hydratase, partial [Alphaproteobacteria bacterium]|nr:aconitate hydratase [Alphaproteobacteria bacterium]